MLLDTKLSLKVDLYSGCTGMLGEGRAVVGDQINKVFVEEIVTYS